LTAAISREPSVGVDDALYRARKRLNETTRLSIARWRYPSLGRPKRPAVIDYGPKWRRSAQTDSGIV